MNLTNRAYNLTGYSTLPLFKGDLKCLSLMHHTYMNQTQVFHSLHPPRSPSNSNISN